MNVEELNKAMANATLNDKSSITPNIPPDNSLGDYLNSISTRHVNNLTYLKPKENKYGKYDVFINPINSEKELQQERARNQSWFEQSWHAAGQMVANELVIGTVLGLSNLVDFFANIGNEKGEDDYTNPVSSWLEGLQDSVRDGLAIYRENPDKAFDIFDSGWWFDNSVSIASSLSMLIPAAGTVKAVSGLGKLAKLTKVGKRVSHLGRTALIQTAKTYKTITRTEKSAGRIANAIKVGKKQIVTAALSRTMENYMEGRETYKEVYQNSLDKVNNMTSEQRKELIHNNPQFEGKSDEEIAKYMASVSADYTFGMDYAMMIFDLWQLRGISALWRPAANKTASAALRLEQKNAIRAMSGLAGETGEKASKQLATKGIKGWGNRQLERLKYPLSTAAGVEWSEGIEEGYQGIMTERGKEIAEMMLDKNFSRRSIISYLKDPAIWEQAFWGVAGGVAFQGAGTYFGNLSNKIKTKINKKDISKEDYALGLTADEKYRAAEIRSRFEKTKAYQAEMERLNGDNPVKKETVVGKNGEIIEKEIPMTESEIEAAKVKATNDYITDIVMYAVDAGNFDLLSDYLKDPTITAALKKVGADVNTMFENELNNYMQTARNQYEDNIYIVGNEAKYDTNESVIRAVARELTRRKIEIDSLNNRLNSVNDEINKLVKNDENGTISELIDKYEKAKIREYINDTIVGLKRARKNVNTNKDKRLSKQAQTAFNEDFDDIERSIEELVNENPDLYNNYKSLKDKLDELLNDENTELNDKEYEDAVDKILKDLFNDDVDGKGLTSGLKKLVDKRIGFKTLISNRKALDPKTHKDYTKLIEQCENEMNLFKGIKLDVAAKEVESYILKQKDLDKAVQDIIDGNVDDDLKNALDVLKWGYYYTQNYVKSILLSVEEERLKRNKNERDSKKVVINGTVITDEQIVKEEQAEVTEDSVSNEDEDKKEKANNSLPVEGDDSTPATPINNQSQEQNDSSSKVINDNYGIAPEDKQAPKQPIVDSTGVEQQGKEKNTIIYDDTIDMSNYSKSDVENDTLIQKLNRTIIKELYKASLKGTIKLDKLDEYKDNVDAIIERIKAAAIKFGYSPEVVNYNIRVAKKFTLSMFKSINNRDNIDSYIAKLITTKASITGDINEQAAIINDAIINFLDAYCDKNGIFPYNGKCKINLESLFDYLLDNNYSVDEIKIIFDNIKSIIGTDSGFIIWSVYNIDDIMSDQSALVESITSIKRRKESAKKSFHISLTRDNANGVNVKDGAVKALLAAGKNPKITYRKSSKYGNSIDFYIEDKDGNTVKIGYVVTATRKNSSTNNVVVYTPNYNVNESKINLIRNVGRLKKGEDYEYSASCDALINAILNNSELFNLAANHFSNKERELTIDECTRFLNILANKRIDFSGIVIGSGLNQQKNPVEFTTALIDSFMNILFYNNNNFDVNAAKLNYEIHKSQVFYNYDFTNRLMDSLNENNDNPQFEISLNKVVAKVGGSISKAIVSKKENNVADVEFNPTDNPIVGTLPTTSGVETICENPNIPVSEIGYKLPIGIMGFYIGERAGSHLIAKITSSNNIDGEIKTLLQKELNALFTKLENDKKNPKNRANAFDSIYTSLSELFNSSLTKNPTIFKGVQIINSTYEFTRYINIRVNNQQIVTISQNSRNNAIEIKYSNKNNKEKAINNIVNNVQYNTSFITLKPDGSNTYFKVDADGFHVNLGGKKLIYNNFADFAIKNRAFNTKQGVSDGSHFEEADDISSIYLTVKDKNGSQKSNINHISLVSIEEKRNDDTTNENISAEEQIKRNNIVLGFVNYIITSIPTINNTINGKFFTIREFIDLLKNKDYIKKYLNDHSINDENTKNYITKTINELYEKLNSVVTNLNKVYLTSGVNITTEVFKDGLKNAQAAVGIRGLSNIIFLNSNKWYAHINPESLSIDFNAKLFNELKRLIIHESLHIKYEKATEKSKAKFKADIESIINEFEQWCEAHKNDKSIDGNVANWFISQKDIFKDDKSGYEEFVVEALSRPELANKLNTIVSNRNTQDEAKESIFGKIVNAILKLLGINVKEGTLYHDIYIALSNVTFDKENPKGGNNTKGTKQTKDTKKTNGTNDTNQLNLNFDNDSVENKTDNVSNEKVENTPEEISEKTEEEKANDALGKPKIETPEEINDFDIDNFDNFNASQTTDIETNFTNRDIIVTNMEEFVNKFPVSEREKIRQMLDSNELNYYCK